MSIGMVGVIGAGTMGNGIAQVCADSGFNVIMIDIADAAIDRGVRTITSNLERLVDKQKISPERKRQVLGRISGSTDYASLRECDAVIEAATENFDLKTRILAEVSRHARDDIFIATNTSSLSVTELAAHVTKPERFIGIHFFNPVPVMALTELVPALQTGPQTLEQVQAFVQRIGKTAIIAKNRPGFAVNRILCPMINEAIFALQEGLATAEDIDTGMKLGCNHPIGPLALADMIGLDTMLAVMNAFYEGFNDPKYRPAPLLREMVAAGYLGRKSGRGFYRYAS